MKKPLVIISACQFTRLALESLIPADRYIVRVLSLLLAGHSWEYSAQFLKTGIRQIWLAEQSLKKRWGIPDSMSLREALLLSSNKFHGDGNALEKTNAMTLRENGNTNRYSVVVNAGTQALSLHKYK